MTKRDTRARFRQLFDDDGWSQYRLARVSGIAQTRIGNYYRGDSDIATEAADHLIETMELERAKKSKKKNEPDLTS